VSAFYREAGSGPGVVCLHSNASSSTQWRGLMDMLAPKFHVLAADSYGAGKSPAYPADRKVGLSDEVALLELVFARAGEPFSLVGHSYGGAVALIAALLHRPKVRALALYEPTLFALVERAQEVDGIRNTVSSAVEALARGDALAAARFFIDFWIAPGAFDRMPEMPREFSVAYVVRAVTPGVYVHPAAVVEDMYRPQFNARTASGFMEVTAGR